jgi:ADP-heptose:LPS heptosyltransferase
VKFLEIANNIIYKFKQNSFSKIPLPIKNVLAVSNTGFGDTILSIPAIKTLKKNFDIKLTLLTKKQFLPLFKDFDYADDFLFYKNGLINQLKLIKEINKRNIDTIFLFHSNGPEDMFFSMLSNAKQILKFTNNQNYPFKQVLLNKPTLPNSHITNQRLELVKIFNPKIIDTRIEVSKHLYFEKKEKNIVGVQLGTQDYYKVWPIENYIEIIKFLLKNNFKVMLFGANKIDREMVSRVLKEINSENILNVCCKTDIEKLSYYLRNIEFLITPDTGTMHLAIALKTPTISLFSPTNSKIWGPNQDKKIHHIIQKNGFIDKSKPKKKWTNKSMKLITSDDVIIEIKKLKVLNENNF